MKETAQSSSVYMNISSCTLHFTDGKKVSIAGDGKKSLIVSVMLNENNGSGIRESVIKHYKSAKTLPELAELCGYTCTKTFSRHFIKSFNTTPKQWILDMRVQEMFQYLQETDKSFEEISHKLDFKNLSHFNNFCKKRTGKTPSEIRKEKMDVFQENSDI